MQRETLALGSPDAGDSADLPQSSTSASWGCKCVQESQYLCALDEAAANFMPELYLANAI